MARSDLKHTPVCSVCRRTSQRQWRQRIRHSARPQCLLMLGLPTDVLKTTLAAFSSAHDVTQFKERLCTKLPRHQLGSREPAIEDL
eukprot:15476309-Alexandrium_andersonii.AAC.1